MQETVDPMQRSGVRELRALGRSPRGKRDLRIANVRRSLEKRFGIW